MAYEEPLTMKVHATSLAQGRCRCMGHRAFWQLRVAPLSPQRLQVVARPRRTASDTPYSRLWMMYTSGDLGEGRGGEGQGGQGLGLQGAPGGEGASGGGQKGARG